MTRSTFARIGVAALLVGVAVGAIYAGTRWYAGHRGLDRFARPPSYWQFGHSSECDGASGSYCYDWWTYVSDERTFAEIRDDIAASFGAHGWKLSRNPDDHFLGATLGDYERCLGYYDLKADTSQAFEDLRQRYSDLMSAHKSVVVIMTGCG
jgi:hypothetical protein